MTGTSDLFNIANGTPAVVGPTGSGTISGGLLRPGSIDQQAFQQMLRAQQSNRAAAGVGGKPVSMPVLPFQNGIPTLSSAQFAALVGDQTPEASDSDDAGLAADPQTAMQQAGPNYGADLSRRLAFGHAQAMAKLANPTLANPATASPTAANPTAANPGAGANPTGASLPALPSMLPSSTLPRAAAIRLSGMPSPQVAGLNTVGLNAAGSNMAGSDTAATADDAPRIFRGPAGVRPVGQQGGGQQGGGQQENTQVASAEAAPGSADPSATGGKPAAAASQSTPPSNPNLVHLKEQPDRDMQMKLRLEHKQWVVDETPGSRQLFFGADGKFGWDDFLDVINPLQHIPIVSQIYRAITGDQINGA
ncbi:MAG TPA: hypothetical protein VGM59_18140, partial [Dongiaceae bacterium]